MWDQSLQQLFFRGGAVMWPLLLCSIVGLAVVLERVAVFLWYTGSFRSLIRGLEKPVRLGDFDEAIRRAGRRRGPVARVAEAYLQNVDRSEAIRDEVVSRVAAEQIGKLEKRVNWLGLLSQIAPMLGLLGTVTGLIDAFHRIELNQGQVQPADLASGIWEALLTTVFGLVIALPVLAAYSLLDHRINALHVQVQLLVAYLNDWRDQASKAHTADDGVAQAAALDAGALSTPPVVADVKDAGKEKNGRGKKQQDKESVAALQG